MDEARRAHHLVAIDVPGLGHSQREDALLSPRAMGEFIVRVAHAFGLDNPHVVGPTSAPRPTNGTDRALEDTWW